MAKKCPKCNKKNTENEWTKIIAPDKEITNKYNCLSCGHRWQEKRLLDSIRRKKEICPKCKKLMGEEVYYFFRRLDSRQYRIRAEYKCSSCKHEWMTKIPTMLPAKKDDAEVCPQCSSVNTRRLWYNVEGGKRTAHMKCEACKHKWDVEDRSWQGYNYIRDEPARLIVI